jgi:hypothetical protein
MMNVGLGALFGLVGLIGRIGLIRRLPTPQRLNANPSILQSCPPHIRNMLKPAGSAGAFWAASIPSAKTRRVSTGSIIPSSQSRAVE